MLRYLEGGTVHTLDLTSTPSPATGARVRSPGCGSARTAVPSPPPNAPVTATPSSCETRATADSCGPCRPRHVPSPATGRVDGLPENRRAVAGLQPRRKHVRLRNLHAPLGGGAAAADGVGRAPAGRTKTTAGPGDGVRGACGRDRPGPGRPHAPLTARSTEDGYCNEIWDTERQRRTARPPRPGRHRPGRQPQRQAPRRRQPCRTSGPVGQVAGQDLVQRDEHRRTLLRSRRLRGWRPAPDRPSGPLGRRPPAPGGHSEERLPGGPLDPAPGSGESITALAFSPDGDTLAVGGDAGTLQLWDIATQQPLGRPCPRPVADRHPRLQPGQHPAVRGRHARTAPAVHHRPVEGGRDGVRPDAGGATGGLTRAQWRDVRAGCAVPEGVRGLTPRAA